MIVIDKNLPVVVKRAVNNSMEQFRKNIKQLGLRFAFLILILLLLNQKEFSIQFTIGNSQAPPPPEPTQQAAIFGSPQVLAVAHQQKTEPKNKKWWDVIKDESKDIRTQINLANAATAVGAALTSAQQKQAMKYSNLGFVLSPNFAQKHQVPAAIVAAKMQILQNYIQKYSSTAKEEANLFGVPASITLAQGLLESNAGKSALARKENNHFGIKCRKKCIGCRCANYTDDSRFDMFRIFDSAWESFREHSKLLSSKRYKHLASLQRSDYKNWAHGLQAAGYATDQKYASKLIKIIEALQLQRFDV